MAKLRARLCISFCSSFSPAEMSTEVTGAGASGDSREEDSAAEEDIRQEALGLWSRETELSDLSNCLLRILVIITSGVEVRIDRNMTNMTS